ncbi:MAG: hypothetical protein H0T93_00900 [Chloroflexia bacterium]|nr:hypothetical protein [Chloroflexia bacterium]
MVWLFRREVPRRFAKPAPDLAAGQVVTPWTAACGLAPVLWLIALVALVAFGMLGFPL